MGLSCRSPDSWCKRSARAAFSSASSSPPPPPVMFLRLAFFLGLDETGCCMNLSTSRGGGKSSIGSRCSRSCWPAPSKIRGASRSSTCDAASNACSELSSIGTWTHCATSHSDESMNTSSGERPCALFLTRTKSLHVRRNLCTCAMDSVVDVVLRVVVVIGTLGDSDSRRKL